MMANFSKPGTEFLPVSGSFQPETGFSPRKLIVGLIVAAAVIIAVALFIKWIKANQN